MITSVDQTYRVADIANVILAVLKEQIGDMNMEYRRENCLPKFAMLSFDLRSEVRRRFDVVGLHNVDTFQGDFICAWQILRDEGLVREAKRDERKYLRLSRSYIREILYTPHEWPAVVYDDFLAIAARHNLAPAGA